MGVIDFVKFVFVGARDVIKNKRWRSW